MGSYKYVMCQGTVSSVEDAFSALEDLASECREVYDNASEGLQQTQRIQTFGDTADTLEGLSCPDVPECVSELAISYSEATKKRGVSRAKRCENAVSVLQAAVDALENWLDGLPDDDDNRDEVDSFKSELEDAISNAEGCEFPGMYG